MEQLEGFKVKEKETEADVLWKKIGFMFENKNIINRIFVFRRIIRLRYHDGSMKRPRLMFFGRKSDSCSRTRTP